MLTAEGCAAPEAALGVASRPCDALIARRPAEPDLLRQLRPVAVRLPTYDAAALLILQPDRRSWSRDNMLRAVPRPEPTSTRSSPPTGTTGKHSAPHRQAIGSSPALERLSQLHALRSAIEAARRPRADRLAAPTDRGRRCVDSTRSIRGSGGQGPRRGGPDPALGPGRRGRSRRRARGIKPGMTELDAYLLVQEAATERWASR